MIYIILIIIVIIIAIVLAIKNNSEIKEEEKIIEEQKITQNPKYLLSQIKNRLNIIILIMLIPTIIQLIIITKILEVLSNL